MKLNDLNGGHLGQLVVITTDDGVIEGPLWSVEHYAKLFETTSINNSTRTWEAGKKQTNVRVGKFSADALDPESSVHIPTPSLQEAAK